MGEEEEEEDEEQNKVSMLAKEMEVAKRRKETRIHISLFKWPVREWVRFRERHNARGKRSEGVG